MKKFIYLLLITLSLYSCNKDEKQVKNYSTINGTIDINNFDKLTLSKIEDGKIVEVATSTINSKKEFGFNVAPEKEGFYVINLGFSNIPLYIKKNQVFDIKIDNENGYVLNSDTGEENRILYDWYRFNDTLRTYTEFMRPNSATYESFFPFYKSFSKEMSGFHSKVNSKNEYFNNLMNTYIDISINYTATHFIFTPRTKHPDYEQIPEFYRNLIKGYEYASTDILKVPTGLNALMSQSQFSAIYVKDLAGDSEFYESVFKDIKNDTLVPYCVLSRIDRFKTYNKEYKNFIEPKRDLIALAPQIEKEIEEYELTIKTSVTGAQGYPFTYKNEADKDVTFESLKGKYTYIDVWAMWCSPCKREIPALKELSKRYKGKEIQFVSISMDKSKLRDKWKKFVKDEELDGIQLMSEDAFNTDIAKDYKINSIPRFLLFDKEGKIVDADAKRPSNPELIKQLDKLL